MKKSIIIVIVIMTAFFLASCLGVESRIKLNADGSGHIFFSYRISQMLLNMGKEAEGEGEESSAEGGSDMPLPITKEDFEEQVEGIEGLRVVNVTQEENEKDLIINAELEFDNVEKLNDSETFSEWTISYKKEGGTYIYKQLITEGSEEDVDEESIAMIESMFAGYELAFSVETPKPIKEHNIGELSADKKTCTYRIPISNMMSVKDRLELIIKW
ncbi:MAG: hypothetical protein JW881_05265 [Spirochaetales bacterium]|nr:hypothetical protein [Spirochaetales bacterium]